MECNFCSQIFLHLNSIIGDPLSPAQYCFYFKVVAKDLNYNMFLFLHIASLWFLFYKKKNVLCGVDVRRFNRCHNHPYYFLFKYVIVLFIKKDNVFIFSIDSMWGGVNFNSRIVTSRDVHVTRIKYSFYVLRK